MNSSLATPAATRYGPGRIEAAFGFAPDARKIKVGKTLTLIFRPSPDQSWYNPHFDFPGPTRLRHSAALLHLFYLYSLLTICRFAAPGPAAFPARRPSANRAPRSIHGLQTVTTALAASFALAIAIAGLATEAKADWLERVQETPQKHAGEAMLCHCKILCPDSWRRTDKPDPCRLHYLPPHSSECDGNTAKGRATRKAAFDEFRQRMQELDRK